MTELARRFNPETVLKQDTLLLYNPCKDPGGAEVKASACNAGDLGSIPGLRRSPGEGNGNPLQDSCLENPIVGYSPWGCKESDTT